MKPTPRPASASSQNYESGALWGSLLEELESLEPTERPLTFREFIALVNPRYQFYRHCEELIAVLQRVADGELRRVLIFMPPRHSKSETVSRLFAAYYLYRHPDRWVAITSYGADLAYTLSRAARENFQRAGGLLHRAATAVKHWQTRLGGGLWAAGVGGPATGKGYHLGIVDDPIKDAEQAGSEVIRAKQQDWYNSVFSTREEPGGATIILQTRWHQRDLSGYVLDQEAEEPESWYVVNLPAIYEEDDVATFPETCTVHPDWRADDEALCPERYSLERLKKLAKRIGSYFFGALFQQQPRPRDGGMFRRAVEIVSALPARNRLAFVRYWDKAGAAPGKGDWTAGVLVAYDRSEGTTYIVDVVRGQWPADERNRQIRQTAELDRQRYGRVRIYIEQPPGLAKEATDAVIKVLKGFPAFGNPVSANKVERADPFSAQWLAGNVKLLAGAWNAAYIEELVSFPTGKNDDQVDASSGGHDKVTKWAEQLAREGQQQGGSQSIETL
ncbi:MAG TPA: phage terminase large subunit [Roseiflexaceae bacterium]|nr:phage terminase large subunit [Roseiflexaceae bacterium]